MGLIDTLKGLFAAAGVSEEDLAALDQVQDDTPGEGAPPPPAPEQQAQGLSPEATALLAQERKAREELQAQVATLTAANTRAQAEKLVDELVSGGHLPPAQRPAAYALIHGALTSGATVTMLSEAAEGQQPTEQQVPAAEALRDLIKARGHAGKFDDRPALHYDGPDDPHVPAPVEDQRLEEIHTQTAGATAKT